MSNQKKAGGSRRGYVPQHRREPSRPPGIRPAGPGGLSAKMAVAGLVGAATLAIPVTGALAASAPPAAGSPVSAADSVTGIPTTLASPPLVAPAPPSPRGNVTFSGFGGFRLPFSENDGITGFGPFGGLFITPPDLNRMPVGSIPLTFPPASPAPGTAATGGAQNFLDPVPSFDPLAHDRLIQGLIDSGIGGGPDAQLSDLLSRFQPQIPSLDAIGGAGSLTITPPTVPAVPFLDLTSQADQLIGQSMAPDVALAPFEQIIENAQAGGFAFPPRPVGPVPGDPAASDAGSPAMPVVATDPAVTVPDVPPAPVLADAPGPAMAPAPVVSEAAPDDATAPAVPAAPVVADAPAPAVSAAPVVADAPAPAAPVVADATPAVPVVADPSPPADPPAPVVTDPPPDVSAPPAPVVAFSPPTDGGGAYYG